MVAVPKPAQFVDLAGEGAKSGRSIAGDAIFRADSVAALPTRNGRLRIGSDPVVVEMARPSASVAFRVDAVISVTAYRGDQALGSALFSLDESGRPGVVAAADGVIGLRARDAFDRIELRLAHAPAGVSGFTLYAAWAEPALAKAAGGGAGNDFAIVCQAPLGVAHNFAFGASLVPGSGLLAQGTAYATNLALKWCLTYIEPPQDRVIRVPAGVCEATYEQPYMAAVYENVL